MIKLDKRLIKVKPSERQMAFQQLEFYGFIHFTINTFTDREWGDGNESPSLFNPLELDANQWVTAVKAAGMKGLILTCKHHDGFCLWPSRYTDHNISASPFRGGNGDLVREVSKACKKEGLKFGIYLSPWDRHDKRYGQGKLYDDYFVSQLKELLTDYGEIFSVWLDGACGEGNNGKKQVYDWNRYYNTVRELQPKACISVCGPDIRWCGNEAGDTRPSEWSVVPEKLRDAEKVSDASQKEDVSEFRFKKLSSMDLDLGSRQALANESKLIWYPAEVNTSIRPGWFYHEHEDNQVRSLEELLEIYYNSVGGNATFLLNLPPDRRGLIHENDVERLKEMGHQLRKNFEINLLEEAEIEAEISPESNDVSQVRKDNYDCYFEVPAGKEPVILRMSWKTEQDISFVVIKENIQKSQRIESFELYAVENKEPIKVYEGTVVGYKKIVRLDQVKTKELMLIIRDYRVAPVIAFIGVY
ncbi:alpha-L-fucosidase [Vallitalea maricola]|uniref:Alpha-L-fucosidase n=1 Tax=Vallitalea maricola TaxID=3074433 RepID=A0ACB5UHB6_9FIRM|nr:alpha-L-fucosidase [Vallitalea sp. AN17-2]